MRILITLSFIIASSYTFAQLHSAPNQYMLNQQAFNPGFMDIATRYSATVSARKQWMSMDGTPLTIAANGHYHLTKNHGVGMVVSNDRVNNVNIFDVGVSYAYHAWLSKKVALGLGLKVGFQQNRVTSDFVYFDLEEPTLANTGSAGVNVGTGLSIQSQNFDFGVSLPYIFNNNIGGRTYETSFNHLYANIGYKLRFSDWFIFYPSAMLKSVPGSSPAISLDGHILANQLLWLGGGYRSDNTISASVGLFLNQGFRIVYSYENTHFSPHKSLNNSHEITLNFARTITELPFSQRLYRKKNGKMFKHPVRK